MDNIVTQRQFKPGLYLILEIETDEVYHKYRLFLKEVDKKRPASSIREALEILLEHEEVILENIKVVTGEKLSPADLMVDEVDILV